MTKKLNLKNLKITPYLAGAFTSLICALGLILIFALIIRYAHIPNKAILPTNICIKIVSIVLGAFVATKSGTKGLLRGGVVGMLFIVFCTVVFAILGGGFNINIMTLADLGLGLVVGSISGVLFVNLHK